MGMIEELRDLKVSSSEDNLRIKEEIKRRLYQNPKIIYLLNNPDLSPDAPDEYVGVNIRPSLIVPTTQSTPMNYICYKSDFGSISDSNSFIKYGQVIFVVLCEQSTLIEKKVGAARHDLIAALIRRIFNYTNIFGNQLILVSDKEATTDTNYAIRTLTFEMKTPNNVTKDGRVINK